MTKPTFPQVSEHIAKLMGNPEIARQYTPVQGLEELAEEKPWKGRIETGIQGVERMYGSEIAIIVTNECAAKCVACIRKNYHKEDVFDVKDLSELVCYIDRERIKEVLITGGDPLVRPLLAIDLIQTLSKTQVRHIRIGTAMFRADPTKISEQLVYLLRDLNKVPGYLEVSPHFDHPAEFTQETTEKIRQFNEVGIKLYTQTILLKGVNDNPDTFRELSDNIRGCGRMEWHYLFHCVPVSGNLHLRTSVERGFELIDSLENHEEVTGRHIPKRYVIPLPIGKVYMDPSRIVGKDGKYLWIETRYTLDSLRGSPLPDFCRQGKKGFLEVKYLDGED